MERGYIDSVALLVDVTPVGPISPVMEISDRQNDSFCGRDVKLFC